MPLEPASPRVRRIAIIGEHASPLTPACSQGVCVAGMARELALAGHAVDIFTRRDAYTQRQVVHWRDNIRVIHVPAGTARHVPTERLLPFIDAFARFAARFARRQARLYEVCHANFFMSGLVAKHLRQALGIPFVVSFHSFGHVRRSALGATDAFPDVRLRIEEDLMRAASRIIAQSPQERHDMERLNAAPVERIDIAPCGFDPEELWPIPNRLARVPRKCIDTVIQAMALLCSQHGIDAELLVVGGNEGRKRIPRSFARPAGGRRKAWCALPPPRACAGDGRQRPAPRLPALHMAIGCSPHRIHLCRGGGGSRHDRVARSSRTLGEAMPASPQQRPPTS